MELIGHHSIQLDPVYETHHNNNNSNNNNNNMKLSVVKHHHGAHEYFGYTHTRTHTDSSASTPERHQEKNE